jgi:hypothetical protein
MRQVNRHALVTTVDPSLRKTLEALAKQHSRTLSEEISVAIREYCSKEGGK